MRIKRGNFYEAMEIARDVKDRVEHARDKGEPIDYLTFVPDGEPTLDINLGNEIAILKSYGIKIAVITNASLLWQEDVRQALQKADLVSLKVDSVSSEIWHRINRPHKSLKLETVLEGMLKFAYIFKRKIITETMLIRNLNDGREELERIAGFLMKLKPVKAYLTIPTRPPARKAIMVPEEQKLNMAFQAFNGRLDSVECLMGYERNEFAITNNLEDDLLAITSVHPMRKEAVLELLMKAGTDWGIVEKLIEDGSLIESEYRGMKFYLRRLSTEEVKTGEP